MVKWFKEHKKLRVAISAFTLMLILIVVMVPVYAQVLVYEDVTGTYNINSMAAPKYMDNARHPRIGFGDGTLIITTQVGKAITDATLKHMGTDVALTGLIGPGDRPVIVLGGTDSDGTVVSIQGRVGVDRDGDAYSITGRMQNYVTSDGARLDYSADGTSEISTVSYHSEPLSCLLTGGTLDNPEMILLNHPVNRLKLRNLANLSTGQLGFWFNFENAKVHGPQMMLRFAPADSTGEANRDYWGGAGTSYVDITIMPYQGYTGTGAWLECDLASAATTTSIYYGNDPTDFTAFGGTPIASMDLVEAAIDLEAAMVAGGDECGNWVLTMVSVELWEGGARTCYIDDVTIGGQLYTLEPNSYYTRLKATIQ